MSRVYIPYVRPSPSSNRTRSTAVSRTRRWITMRRFWDPAQRRLSRYASYHTNICVPNIFVRYFFANIFLNNFSFTIGWAFGTLKSSQLVSDIFGGPEPTNGHGHMTSSSQWDNGSETVRMRNGFPINTFQNFNISLFENDPEFYDFVRSVIPRPQARLQNDSAFPDWLTNRKQFWNLLKLKSGFNSNFPGSDSKSKPAIRKYMTLKQMIMFFQKTPVFGKFSFYGCWCFPDGASDILSGYGEPVDNIDKERIQKSAIFIEIGPFVCPYRTFSRVKSAISVQNRHFFRIFVFYSYFRPKTVEQKTINFDQKWYIIEPSI